MEKNFRTHFRLPITLHSSTRLSYATVWKMKFKDFGFPPFADSKSNAAKIKEI